MHDPAPTQGDLKYVKTLYQSLEKDMKRRSGFRIKYTINNTTLPDALFFCFDKLGESPLDDKIKTKAQKLNPMLEALYKQYPDHGFIKAHYAAILNLRAMDIFELEGSEKHNLNALELAQKSYSIFPVPEPMTLIRILNIIAINILKQFPNVNVKTLERAIEYYKKSLELIPDQEKLAPPFHVKTSLSIAYSLLFQKLNESNVDKRIDCLRAAAEYDPDISLGRDAISNLYAFLMNTAQDLQKLANHKAAITLLEEAYQKYSLHLSLYPDNTNFLEGMQICNLLATSYQAIGNEEMAAKYSEKSKHSTIDLSKFANSAYSGVTINFSTM